ncbi:hypothetical protein BDV28DRAFT_155259 [Aspergillus coremiiformis]|uniref:Uncharacterized protein n=1 Tax=Aspergillus coremiiformis TaxID=138285 RepID=A0A5N6ZDD1_9EURO|nr:hypothetical protein BDV28DRAFT_155259 [Aspergillus coremiiformis]
MAIPQIWHRKFTRASGLDSDALMTANASPATCNLRMYVVADGAHVDRSTLPKAGDSWFNPHCRLLGVVDFQVQGQSSADIIFIVGSDEVHNSARFLQVASWDGNAFHYYAVEDINGDSNDRKLTYQASSFDAFTDGSPYDMSYIGPFNGHVNGACIMKELHDPWYHWQANRDLKGCLSQQQIDLFKRLPYLSSPWALFSRVTSAEDLETNVVTPLVNKWFNLHANRDFNGQHNAQPANLHRWMAHLLLTTTINIATGSRVAAVFEHHKQAGSELPLRSPKDLFMNFELLTRDQFSNINAYTNRRDQGPLASFSPEFSLNNYQSAIRSLRISLIQEWGSKTPPNPNVKVEQLQKGTLGGGKQTDSYDVTNFLVVKEYTEGDHIYFVALQASLEDSVGVLNLPNNLVSDKLRLSIILLDFFNPVYSWRRGVLMRYLPRTTILVNGTYDMEATFIANIPRFQSYLNKVRSRLGTIEGLTDYLRLAESHRRIYRPLPPDEFGMTLPYALELPTTWKLIEMKEDATVTDIPERGLKFLRCWTGTLHGYDPHLLPPDGCYAQARWGRCSRQ